MVRWLRPDRRLEGSDHRPGAQRQGPVGRLYRSCSIQGHGTVIQTTKIESIINIKTQPPGRDWSSQAVTQVRDDLHRMGPTLPGPVLSYLLYPVLPVIRWFRLRVCRSLFCSYRQQINSVFL